MAREAIAPVRTPGDHRTHDWNETHPAYGSFGFSRISGSAQLFGSSVRHQGYIELTVSHAQLSGDAYHEQLSPRTTILKVWMSEAQFVAAVSRMNGADVPCTLVYECTGDMVRHPEIAEQPSAAEKLEIISKEVHQRLTRQARERADKVREICATLPKRKAEEILMNLDLIINHTTENANYGLEVMTKRKERLVEESKTEIEAMASALITRLGLASAQQLGQLLAADPHQALKLLGQDKP